MGDAIKRIHENKPVSPLFKNRFRGIEADQD